MGDQELHAIIGQTVIEHSDAKRKLASLEAKAHSFARTIRLVAQELNPLAGAHPEYSREALAEALRKYPTRDEITALLSDRKQTCELYDAVVMRLRDMGVDV